MGSYFWEQYHFDYIFEILIRENARFGTPPRILLSITDPTQNWLLAPAPPSVETPGTGCRLYNFLSFDPCYHKSWSKCLI